MKNLKNLKKKLVEGIMLIFYFYTHTEIIHKYDDNIFLRFFQIVSSSFIDDQLGKIVYTASTAI